MSMKWEENGVKSPLARARGLGSAHSGTEHWWHERLTSIAALPLCLWLIWAAATMPGWNYETFSAWLAAPLNAILMILSIIVLYYHAALGSRVIVEDYIHSEWFKMVKLVGIKLFFFATAVAAIFAVLKVALAG